MKINSCPRCNSTNVGYTKEKAYGRIGNECDNESITSTKLDFEYTYDSPLKCMDCSLSVIDKEFYLLLWNMLSQVNESADYIEISNHYKKLIAQNYYDIHEVKRRCQNNDTINEKYKDLAEKYYELEDKLNKLATFDWCEEKLVFLSKKIDKVDSRVNQLEIKNMEEVINKAEKLINKIDSEAISLNEFSVMDEIDKIKLLAKDQVFMCDICNKIYEDKRVYTQGKILIVRNYCDKCDTNFAIGINVSELSYGSVSVSWENHPSLNEFDRNFIRAIGGANEQKIV